MCGGDDFFRYHRKLWMHLFAGSQYLRCRTCRTAILLLRDKRGRYEQPAVRDLQ